MNFAFCQKFNLKAIEYFLVASSMILVIVSTRSGMGVSWDSTDYMAVGRNMASGIGPIDVVGLPMTVRPPGISFLICVGDWLGLMPSTTFVVINTASAGVSTYFAMLILRMSNIQEIIEVAALSVLHSVHRFSICLQWLGQNPCLLHLSWLPCGSHLRLDLFQCT